MAQETGRSSRGEPFPQSLPFFKDGQQRDQAISNVANAINLQPNGWSQLEREVIPFLFSEPGIMKSLVSANPELGGVVRDFLTGRSKVTLVGGVPGNGKSLLVTGLRRLHEIYSGLDPSLQFPLAVVPWDKVHEEFFKVLSTQSDQEIKPPSGETDPVIRNEVSQVMLDTVMFLGNQTRNARILVEAPLYGGRGKVIQDAFEKHHIPGQTVVMNSPEMQREITKRGSRDVTTSGQPEAIAAIDDSLLRSMVGSYKIPSEKRKDTVKQNYWNISVGERGGVVVTWNPNTDRPGFELTRAQYKEHATRPDDYSPEPLGTLVTALINARLSLIPNAKFLELVERSKSS